MASRKPASPLRGDSPNPTHKRAFSQEYNRRRTKEPWMNGPPHYLSSAQSITPPHKLCAPAYLVSISSPIPAMRDWMQVVGAKLCNYIVPIRPNSKHSHRHAITQGTKCPWRSGTPHLFSAGQSAAQPHKRDAPMCSVGHSSSSGASAGREPGKSKA